MSHHTLLPTYDTHNAAFATVVARGLCILHFVLCFKIITHYRTPSRIRHVSLKDESARQKLLEEVCGNYNLEVEKRKAIKEQREEDEIKQLAKDLAEKEIKQMQTKQSDLLKGIEKLTVDLEKTQQDVVRIEAEKKGEIEAKTAEAKKVRKQRRSAEDQLVKLEEENKVLDLEVTQLKEQLALKGDEIDRARQGEEFRNEGKEEEEAQRAEAHYVHSQELFDNLIHLRNHQLDYMRHRIDVAKLLKEKKAENDHRLQTAHPFAEEIVNWLVDRSVRVSEGTASLHDGETFDHLTRLLPSENWPNPLSVTHIHQPSFSPTSYPDAAIETDYESDSEDLTSPDAAYAEQQKEEASPKPVQYDFMSSQKKKEEEAKKIAEEKAKQRQRQVLQQARQARNVASDITKKYDEEEADKMYLMSIYDKEHLVGELLRYLYTGTILTKHGRTGKPHKRKFYLPCVGSGQNELTWTEPVPTPGDKGKRGVLLPDITGMAFFQKPPTSRFLKTPI